MSDTRLRLRLPATSANLGPGFDALGLAMGIALEIEAELAADGVFRIAATGRNAQVCGRVERNLVLETYKAVVRAKGKDARPLALQLQNGIPLGMGCGSSAAALLGGVLLANHFGGLGWTSAECMDEASRREGHPDNVAACALGAMTISCSVESRVVAATCGLNLPWKLFVALPVGSLATEKARALLPKQYSRADAVSNVQRTALLVAAFSQGRGELLKEAMRDRMHQPYRMGACPLLARLLPMAGEAGVLGVALSGAGPGVLVIVPEDADATEMVGRIRSAAGEPGLEVVETRIGPGVSVVAE
jgi:homoserine kinase